MNFQMLQILFLSAITLCAFITLGSEEVESFKTAGHFVFTYATAKELYLHNSFTNETETLFTLTNGMGSVECDPQRNLTFVYSTLLMNTTIHKVSFGGDAEVIANSSRNIQKFIPHICYRNLAKNAKISVLRFEQRCPRPRVRLLNGEHLRSEFPPNFNLSKGEPLRRGDSRTQPSQPCCTSPQLGAHVLGDVLGWRDRR